MFIDHFYFAVDLLKLLAFKFPISFDLDSDDSLPGLDDDFQVSCHLLVLGIWPAGGCVSTSTELATTYETKSNTLTALAALYQPKRHLVQIFRLNL